MNASSGGNRPSRSDGSNTNRAAGTHKKKTDTLTQLIRDRPSETSAATPTEAMVVDPFVHLSGCAHRRRLRYCQSCVTRRRRISRLLDELLADMYPDGQP